ncbi:hypothetical protein [Methylobacterium sp. J-068]|uniref:hypothetical protein n=1 Tax=Methylobacterium sp. J-068 TaxID=2836649 RepID=UPI001FBB4355|nr:hypothetical protein [Methylobacterium sp. J-068]MCJ2034337.1 hypothetical protein [Methylobacterium sp. J-068]
MRSTLTAVTLLGLLLGPARAQEPPPAPPDGMPSGPVSPADRQRNNAAKLAGLIGFVRTHCPELSPDDARFRAVLARLGVPFDDLQAGDLHLRALAYAETYAKDVPANCARAVTNFGENGQTVPGLIAKR